MSSYVVSCRHEAVNCIREYLNLQSQHFQIFYKRQSKFCCESSWHETPLSGLTSAAILDEQLQTIFCERNDDTLVSLGTCTVGNAVVEMEIFRVIRPCAITQSPGRRCHLIGSGVLRQMLETVYNWRMPKIAAMIELRTMANRRRQAKRPSPTQAPLCGQPFAAAGVGRRRDAHSSARRRSCIT